MATAEKVSRDDLKSGEVLCDYCTAKCCRYFALPIDMPDRMARISSTSAGTCCTIGRRCSSKTTTGTLLVHTTCKHLRRITAAASTKPGRRSAATTRPTTASTKTTGSTTSTSRRPSRSTSMPRRSCRRGAAQGFAARSPRCCTSQLGRCNFCSRSTACRRVSSASAV